MQNLDFDDVNDLFYLLIEHVPIGVALIDRDLRLQYINARHAKMNNLSVSEHIGKRVADFLPHSSSVIEPKLRFVLDTGIPLLNQEIFGTQPAADGHILHRMASYYPWRTKNGDVKGVMAIIQDSSIDQFSQQLLVDSQHRLLSVLDNLFAFVGVMELDGTLTHANKAPLEAAGLLITDVTGKKVWDCYWFCHDLHLQQRLKSDTVRCRNGELIRYDMQVRMINGSLMWIDFMLAPLRDKDGNVTHLIPSAMDISERHATAEALQISEERFQSIVESSDEAIITKTLDGIITGWNPAAVRLLGYSQEQAIGQPVTMLFPPGTASEEEQLLKKISRGERVPPFETVRIRQDGSRIDVSVTVSPLRDRHGAVVGACKLAHDVSLQKRHREQIEHALEEKTSLLHEVHHRVKNNLQIVSSLLNLQSRKVSADAARALAECQGRIRAMVLVHQLLYESNSMSEVDLSAYLNQLILLTDASYSASVSGIKLVFLSSDQGITLDIQRTIPCGMVVYELVLNAIKHAFQESTQGRVEVNLRLQSDGLLYLSVRDNGHGLPDNFSWDAKMGLGTQLIPMFVNQLGGAPDHGIFN